MNEWPTNYSNHFKSSRSRSCCVGEVFFLWKKFVWRTKSVSFHSFSWKECRERKEEGENKANVILTPFKILKSGWRHLHNFALTNEVFLFFLLDLFLVEGVFTSTFPYMVILVSFGSTGQASKSQFVVIFNNIACSTFLSRNASLLPRYSNYLWLLFAR